MACAVLCALGLSVAEPSRAAEALPGLAEFVDGYMADALPTAGVPGAVVLVVQDGRIVFQKGYGFADLDRRTPVSPDATLFRLGSVSKLFAWTAVMQLAEQGKVDLDADVNRYLDFRIPGPPAHPVTLRLLMTHRAGFEDVTKDHYPWSARGLKLHDYLSGHIPKIIFQPGSTIAYSNYGAGLASYVVERVSGEPFDDYVARHIFQPLGMSRSSFAQPLPPDLQPLLARSYAEGSQDRPDRFRATFPAASGGISATAVDMAAFMIAHLQDGRYGQARILRPETARLMHSHQYEPAPGFNGFALGFGEESRNGRWIIGHGGSTTTYYTDLMLLPREGLGLFVSVNGAGPHDGGHHLPSALTRAIVDRYFPAPVPAEPTWRAAHADATRVAGVYLSTRRTESSFRFLQFLFQNRVGAREDGTITISSLKKPSGEPKRWREIGPLLYREIGGQARVAFVTGPDGAIRYWTTDDFPPVMLFQRIGSGASASNVLPWLGAALAVMLASLLVAAGGLLVRRHYRASLELTPAERRTRLASRAAAALALALAVGWAALTAWILSDDTRLSSALDPWMYGLYGLGVVCLAGMAAIVANAVVVWRGRRPGVLIRLGETLLALAAAYLAWFILAFGLVSFSVRI